MKTYLIKLLSGWLDKLGVISFSEPLFGYEYFYVSTKRIRNNADLWIDWGNSVKTDSVDPLLESRKKDGWFVSKMWHTIENNIYHSHWIFARSKNVKPLQQTEQ